MISSLLTALGVAALSIQTPSNIQPQEPKRAYYDSSAVADYGTTLGKGYNYSSTTFYNFSVGPNTNNAIENEFSLSPSGHYNPNAVYSTQAEAEEALTEIQNSYDVYVNGTLIENAWMVSSVPSRYVVIITQEAYATGYDNNYLWIFDHNETNMSETIAEVVGDATTAAGAVLGSGISGAIALFYNEGITGLGIIALILTGVSLVWFAFSLVLRLWRRR